MNKLFKLLMLAVLVSACSKGNHAEFETNTATAKKYFELHQAENSEEMFELLHDDLEWHIPVYGSPMVDIDGLKDAILNYQQSFDNMNFTADYWLPGINVETGELDGSTRVYGTWTADHVASGKSVNLTAYHSFDFKDGKIVGGGDWFDFGGMMNSLAEESSEEPEE